MNYAVRIATNATQIVRAAAGPAGLGLLDAPPRRAGGRAQRRPRGLPRRLRRHRHDGGRARSRHPGDRHDGARQGHGPRPRRRARRLLRPAARAPRRRDAARRHVRHAGRRGPGDPRPAPDRRAAEGDPDRLRRPRGAGDRRPRAARCGGAERDADHPHRRPRRGADRRVRRHGRAGGRVRRRLAAARRRAAERGLQALRAARRGRTRRCATR